MLAIGRALMSRPDACCCSTSRRWAWRRCSSSRSSRSSRTSTRRAPRSCSSSRTRSGARRREPRLRAADRADRALGRRQGAARGPGGPAGLPRRLNGRRSRRPGAGRGHHVRHRPRRPSAGPADPRAVAATHRVAPPARPVARVVEEGQPAAGVAASAEAVALAGEGDQARHEVRDERRPAVTLGDDPAMRVEAEPGGLEQLPRGVASTGWRRARGAAG